MFKIKVCSLPENCRDCIFFRQVHYQCHNESGLEAECKLGYMVNKDMRDFTGFERYKDCMLKVGDVFFIRGVKEI